MLPSEVRAQGHGQGPGCKFLAANDTERQLLGTVAVIGQFDRFDYYRLGLERNVLACTAQGIGSVAINFHCTVGRRHLLYLAHKLRQNILDHFPRNVPNRIGMVHRMFHIVTGSSCSQL